MCRCFDAAMEVMIFDNLPHHAIEVKLCKRLEESCGPVSLTKYIAAICCHHVVCRSYPKAPRVRRQKMEMKMKLDELNRQCNEKMFKITKLVNPLYGQLNTEKITD